MGESFEHVSRAGLLAAEVLGHAPAAERLAGLPGEPVLLAIGAAEAATRRGQLLLATAANLLGRLFVFAPAIDVDAAPVSVVPGVPGLRAGRPLGAEVQTFLESLSPPASPFRYRAGAAAVSYRTALVIGDRPPPAPVRDAVCVGADAWRAAVGPEPVSLPAGGEDVFNPLGALVAAALGAAEIAKRIFLRLAEGHPATITPLERSVTWDLWQHRFDGTTAGPALPRRLDLGRIAVAGVGAIGSAATLALAALEDVTGTVELVDDDTLSVTNLERVVTARAADVGRRKVDVAARALRGTSLGTVRMAARFAIHAPAASAAETILVGVDSGAARRRIMNLLPHAVYNGGTQGSELLVSRHVGLEGPCLECLYPESTGAPPAAQECGRAVVVDELPEATIGFVSALAGFLMVAELVKDRMGGAGPLDAARPVARLDALGGTPEASCVEAYRPRRDCFCQSPETRRRARRTRRA